MTLGVDERIAPLVAAVLAVPASFVAARFVLARQRPAREDPPVSVPDLDPATLRLTVVRR